MASIAIEGLNQVQIQALSNVQVGSLILFNKSNRDDDEDESEDEGDDYEEDEDGDEGMSDDDGDTDEEADEGSDSSDSNEDEDTASLHKVDQPVKIVSGDEEADQASDVPGTGIDQLVDHGLGNQFPLSTTTIAQPNATQSQSPAVGSKQELDSISTGKLYIVHDIITGVENAIEDIKVLELTYNSHVDREKTFQIYGPQIVHSSSKTCTRTQCSGCEPSISVSELADDAGFQIFLPTIDPCGDLVRARVSDTMCPLRCSKGWLTSKDSLSGIIKDYVSPSLLEHQPVCPVCIGLELTKEHEDLRAQLEVFNVVDMGNLLDFYGRLNVRRRQVGHRFHQFDERQWGMLFDDMVSEEESDEDGSESQYEQWDEAMVPNSDVKLRPASEADIAALPRKKYRDAKGEDEEKCLVCQDTFDDEQVVAILPCTHFFCDGGCIEQWLRNYNSCPNCRATIPAQEQETTTAEDISNIDPTLDSSNTMQAGMNGAESIEQPVADAHPSPEVRMDSEDVLMADA